MKTVILILVILFTTARLNAQSWSPVGGGTDQTVLALGVFNNDLYVAGAFISVGGVSVNGMAKWNGTNWLAAGTPPNEVYVMKVYNNELYEGGFGGVAKWNGTNWVRI